MERKKNEEGKQRWKKVGGGSLRLGNRIIKPGQEFIAAQNEIPKLFRNVVVPIGGPVEWEDEKKPSDPPVKVTTPVYKLLPHGESALWYDVVDGQGKVINDKSLKKEVAEKLIEDLLKQFL